DRDAARADLFGQRPTKLLHGSLAAEIAAPPGNIQEGSNRRDTYDPAAIGHVPQRFLKTKICSLCVDSVGVIEVLLGRFRHRFEARIPCVCDENIEPSQPLNGFSKK